MRPRAGWLVVAFGLAGSIGSQAPPAVTISDHRRVDESVRRCLDGPGPIAGYRDTEPYAVADPKDPRHLVAIWQSGGPGGSAMQTSTSFDGGASWTPAFALPMTACAGGPIGAAGASDGWLTVGADGTVYAAGIGWQPNDGNGPDRYNALIVAASRDRGRRWGPPVIVAVGDTAAGVAHDNVAIAADPNDPKRLYLVTTRYARTPSPTGPPATIGPIGVTRSDDAGRTWERLRSIGPAPLGGRVSAPQLVVDPSGPVRIIYYRAEGSRRVVGMVTSADRGASWSEEVVIAPHVVGPYRAPHPVTGADFVFAIDVLQAALDATRGILYVAYADARLDSTKSHGVSIVWSRDGGATWSKPQSVSGPAFAHAWLPAIALGPDGEVGVGYLKASFAKMSDGLAPVEFHVARFTPGPNQLGLIDDLVVERANLAWPGDYHALVHTSGGFRLISSKSTLGPSDRMPADVTPRSFPNPTDVFIR